MNPQLEDTPECQVVELVLVQAAPLKIVHGTNEEQGAALCQAGIPTARTYPGSIMSRKWFSMPPVCVADWAKPGFVRQISSVEAAAEQILNWPKSKKRDKAALLITDAYAGKADIEKAKRAFEVAAKEAKVSLLYRGPFV